MFNEYELTVIIRPDLDDPATYAIVEKIEGIVTESDGTLLHRDDWGKRKLAYGIDRHLKGHYVLLDFAAKPGLVIELERRMRNEDAILRFLTVRLGEGIDLETRVKEAAEKRERLEEEARLRAEEIARQEALHPPIVADEVPAEPPERPEQPEQPEA